MNFYIDESGTFSIPQGIIQHKACVVTCVVISDIKLKSLENKFLSFCSNLPPHMISNGEPKGSNFDVDKKLEFCEMLSEFRDYMLVIPVTLDMTLLAMLDSQRKMKTIIRDKILELCVNVEHESTRNELELLGKQIGNISEEDFLKISCYAYAFFISFQHAVMVLSINGNEKSWDDIILEIDRINPKKDSREKLIFNKMVSMWGESWSKKSPIKLLKDIHTDDHPIVRNFNLKDGLDSRKITALTDWSDSKQSWGLQVADIASNIVYCAVNDLENHYNSFTPFCKLMTLSTYGYDDGPGLFTPFEMRKEEYDLIRSKYIKLGKEMIGFGFQKNYKANYADRLDQVL